MAVGRDRNGRTWRFIVDAPITADGRRRQKRRRGFATERLARQGEQAAIKRVHAARLVDDGTVAAELTRWLEERELDLSVTGLAAYQDYIRPTSCRIWVTGSCPPWTATWSTPSTRSCSATAAAAAAR